ncbi:flagellar hook protein FlgE [Paraburkholderia sp.]|jgi:flagellar hook protein FlgE|uniref:flagellar hook protein FlgE n=1 Tax=Paraburkholderia sp. TaxID=1926495 RepID=UPI000F461CF7|nr:flagellar hook-basal body complex protein [Paraburkholderia sp.]
MGYQQGLSGLGAASSDLDVIGNNIANSDTIGFKSGTAVFADMYANSVATAVNNQIGIGTQLAEVQQQFSQGTINTTGQALDVAINGNGFFQMSNNGSLTYSRNGVFQLSNTGNIVNSQGLDLMGYAANSSGIINSAQTVPLTVPTTNIAPTETTSITAQLNLDAQDSLMLGTPAVNVTTTGTLASSGATITTASAGSNNDDYTIAFTSPTAYTVTDADNAANDSSGTYTAGTAITLGNGQTVTLTGTAVAGDTVAVTPTPTTFDASNSSTYNYSTSTQVYDSLGGSQTVNMYFAKTGSGAWDVYAGVSGGTASLVGTANFSTSGALTGITSVAATTSTDSIAFTIPNTDGSGTPQPLTLDLAGTTQFGSTDGVNNLQQNGFAAGQLTSFTVGTTGILTGNYSNGQTASLGQVVLANFNDPNGLVDLGNNEYAQTAASGAAQISTPGSTNHGTLQGGAVEDSNVDLTNELVNLITAQRDYQANAQTIKTQQTVDQTLINM